MRNKTDDKVKWKNIRFLLAAFITTFVLMMNLDVISEEMISNTVTTGSRIVRFITILYLSVDGLGIQSLIILIALCIFYRCNFLRDISRRHKNLAMILAIICAVFILVGNSYYKTKSAILLTHNVAQMGKSLIAFVGYTILCYALVLQVWYCLDRVSDSSLSVWKSIETDNITKRVLGKGISPFIRSVIILTVIWLPYVVASYPGVLTFDAFNQLAQVYGIIPYMDNHPVLHTVVLGGCVRLGEVIFHSQNVGIFIYIFLQCTTVIGILSYSVKRITDSRFSFLGIPFLSYYCLVPIFQSYTALLTKDALWAPFILLWYILFLDILKYYESHQCITHASWIKLFLLSMIVCLFCKKGIYFIIISSFGMFFVLSKKRKQVLAFLVCVVVCFQSYSGIFLPALGVQAGSKREMLSIPFQQTARYVSTYPDEVTEEEKTAIDKVLDYDSLADIYNPELSDPVKGTYREDITSTELKAYFKIWFQMFLKHPGTYVSATINNYYGFFYFARAAYFFAPTSGQEWLEKHQELFPKMSYYYGSDFINELRNFYQMLLEFVKKIPGISLFMTAAIYQWIMLFMLGYLFLKRHYKAMIVYIPLLSILLINLAGPANGTFHFRYEYPIAFCLPYILIWTLHDISNTSRKEVSSRKRSRKR